MATSYLDKTGLSYFWGKIKNYVNNAIKITGIKGDAEESYRTGNVNITASDIGALPQDTVIPPEMVVLSYGTSTWNDFLTAYQSNSVVYCRASSNSNPGSGAQGRMAFMAYVNNGTNPTEVEFQYYRSVSSHTASQQGDQVYIYKLNKNTGWSVTVRESMSKIAVGEGLASTYKSGTLTLSATGVFPGKVTAGSNASESMDLVTLSQLETTVSNALPYYHTTLNTPASTFTIAHNLNTINVEVFVIGMESSSTYMVPMSSTAVNLAYMVNIVDNNTVALKFSKNLEGTYHVNILGKTE